MPRDFDINGVYLPPSLVAGVLGVILAVITARILDRYRLTRLISQPSVTFLSICVLYTVLIGTFVIPT